MKELESNKRIETKLEVSTYLDRLNYAIRIGNARIILIKDRNVDKLREQRFTNRHTLALLFPDEDEIDALKRELTRLTPRDYIETVKDHRFPNRSEMRVFGKNYSGKDVYIKIRVELASSIFSSGCNHVMVMSFHFSLHSFRSIDFPYGNI